MTSATSQPNAGREAGKISPSPGMEAAAAVQHLASLLAHIHRHSISVTRIQATEFIAHLMSLRRHDPAYILHSISEMKERDMMDFLRDRGYETDSEQDVEHFSRLLTASEAIYLLILWMERETASTAPPSAFDAPSDASRDHDLDDYTGQSGDV